MYELNLLCPEAQVEDLSEALEALDALSVSVEDADAQTEHEQALFGEPGMPPPKEGWQRSKVVALFAKEKEAIANFKKCILMVAGAAVQKLMMTLNKEQEILMNIADMSIITFHAESALLRVEKLAAMHGEAAVAVQADITRTYIYDAADAINKAGKDALNSFAEGDELRMMLLGLKRFTKSTPFNCKDARRRIADHLIAANKYPW
jgi:hypothetical protein